MLNIGAQQTPPKVDRVPYIPMLKENNVRKGFFEHGDFIALRDALPSYLKPFVSFSHKVGWRDEEISGLTRSVFERYNIVSDADLKLAAQKQELYLQTQMGTISGTVRNFEGKKKSGTSV